VQCSGADASACGGVTPICDAATATCTACTAHAQCDGSACELATGACFAKVLHVDRGSPCDGDGSVDKPFCEINDAVTKVGPDDPTAILVQPNTMPYTEQVQVPAGRVLAIVRDGAGVAKLEVGAFDALTVSDGASVYLDQLQLSKGDVSKGIFCSGGDGVDRPHADRRPQGPRRRGLRLRAAPAAVADLPEPRRRPQAHRRQRRTSRTASSSATAGRSRRCRGSC
jgi:hypothetical protein